MEFYPCIGCSKEVRRRQHAVECDWCNKWQHRTCGTGISLTAYREAMRKGNCTFVCKPCLEAESERCDGSEMIQTDEEMPTLEISVPISEEGIPDEDVGMEMPVLALNVPVDDGYFADTVVDMHVTQDQNPFGRSIADEDVDVEMPVLESSVPVDASDFNDTVVDMHITLEQVGNSCLVNKYFLPKMTNIYALV